MHLSPAAAVHGGRADEGYVLYYRLRNGQAVRLERRFVRAAPADAIAVALTDAVAYTLANSVANLA